MGEGIKERTSEGFGQVLEAFVLVDHLEHLEGVDESLVALDLGEESKILELGSRW